MERFEEAAMVEGKLDRLVFDNRPGRRFVPFVKQPKKAELEKLQHIRHLKVEDVPIWKRKWPSPHLE